MTAARKLQGIAELSKKEPNKTFINLMCMFNVVNLKECFNMLDENKAFGLYKKVKNDYALNIDENLEDLVARMKRMSYRPGLLVR